MIGEFLYTAPASCRYPAGHFSVSPCTVQITPDVAFRFNIHIPICGILQYVLTRFELDLVRFIQVDSAKPTGNDVTLPFISESAIAKVDLLMVMMADLFKVSIFLSSSLTLKGLQIDQNEGHYKSFLPCRFILAPPG